MLGRTIASGLLRPSPSSSRALLSSSAALLQSSDAPALVYSEHGDPERVLSYVSDAGFGGVDRRNSSASTSTSSSTSSSSSSVLVRWLASPVNWSDVNVVEGTYPGAPPPPATPGNEGAGVVEEVLGGGDGDDGGLSPLKKGDLVVPLAPAAGALGGTWRRYSVASRADLHRIDPSLGLRPEQAATLCINPPTALHLLEDFVKLQPGSTLVQTGATTAVGKLVIQLASSRGVSTVNVVRDRGGDEELAEVKRDLEKLGGGSNVVVLSESEIAGVRSFKDLASSLSAPLAPPSLALNCTGGASASSALRLLSPGSPFVTYGGLSRKPLTIPASALIFRDIKFVGFWLSKGLSRKGDEGEEGRRRRASALQRRRSDLDRVASLVSRGTISTEVEKVPMERWREALEALRRGGAKARKQVLVP